MLLFISSFRNSSSATFYLVRGERQERSEQYRKAGDDLDAVVKRSAAGSDIRLTRLPRLFGVEILVAQPYKFKNAFERIFQVTFSIKAPASGKTCSSFSWIPGFVWPSEIAAPMYLYRKASVRLIKFP